MSRAGAILLITAVVLMHAGCGKITGPRFTYAPSPRAVVLTPASPAEGDVTVAFLLVDRELEPADVAIEYSTDGAQTFLAASITAGASALSLETAYHPGALHSVQWDSVADGIALSGDVQVCVRVTPSDASNPAGASSVSGTFIVNNIAYNTPPTAAVMTPAGVQSGDIPIDYFLSDAQSDTCSVEVLYSTNGGTSWQAATMAAAGDGVTGLSTSPAGIARLYYWDSRADGVAPGTQTDTIRVRIIPTDFNTGTAGETSSFSVDNSIVNDLPTVAITGGPADGSTVYATQVALSWSGSDIDGSVIGYYCSFDRDPANTWTTTTSALSPLLSEGQHVFRVVAIDNLYDASTPAMRTFTVAAPGTITAEFTAAPLAGPAPLSVSFTDLSTATHGITSWSWTFGNGDTSSERNPACIYGIEGQYTVSLTVTGPDGSDTETKTGCIAAGDGSAYQWTRVFDASLNDSVEDVSTDGAGNVYFTGDFYGTINFAADWGGSDSKTTAGNNDAFVTRINADGSYGWTRRLGGAGSDYGISVRADWGGNVYLMGYFCSTSVNFAGDWGGDDVKTDGGNADLFLTKIDSAGDYCWTRAIGAFAQIIPREHCVDGLGNVFMAGFFRDTMDFADDWGGSDPKTSAGSDEAFVTKVNANGTYGWTRRIGDTLGDSISGICTDADNNVFVAGTFSEAGITNFAEDWGGTDEKTGAGYGDIFVTRINANGSYGWTHRMGGSDSDYGKSICVDTSGNLYVAGYFKESVNFAEDWSGTDTKVSAGNEDMFVTKLDTDGAYSWTHRIGGTLTEAVWSVRNDSHGNVFVSGYYQSTVNFAEDWGGDDTRTASASGCITKILASGDYSVTWELGSSGVVGVYGTWVDPNDNFYATGSFGGTVNFAAAWGGLDEKTCVGNNDIFVTKITLP